MSALPVRGIYKCDSCQMLRNDTEARLRILNTGRCSCGGLLGIYYVYPPRVLWAPKNGHRWFFIREPYPQWSSTEWIEVVW